MPSLSRVIDQALQDASVTTAKLAANAVTYAKLQNVSAGKVLGRDTSGAGVVQELPISVTSFGEVGVGTSTPRSGYLLTAGSGGTGATNGNLNLDGSSAANQGSGIRFARNGSAIAYIGSSSWINGDNSNDLVFSADSGGVQGARLDSSANFKFNSGYGSVATAYGCRAWVNFNGTGTVAIRGSGNVSSITDNGTGDYHVNFSTAMPDGNYSVVTNSDKDNAPNNANHRLVGTYSYGEAPATTRCRISSSNAGNSALLDMAYIMVSFFR